MEPWSIYVDLDGTLTDFVGEACKAHGRPMPTNWIESPKLHEIWGMSIKDFWKPLDFDFWVNLPWLPDGRELLATIEEMARRSGEHDVLIVSSPSADPMSYAGKAKWIQRNINRYSRNCMIGGNKPGLAHPRAVMIDDTQDTIQKFRAKRQGKGILVPRPWNRKYVNQTVPNYVQDQLLALGF